MIGGVSTEGRLTGIQAFKACPEAPTNIAAPGFYSKEEDTELAIPNALAGVANQTYCEAWVDGPNGTNRKRRRHLLHGLERTKSVYGVVMLTVSAGITLFQLL